MKLFISYRRDDSSHQADRLCKALQDVVPRRNLFIDIDSIPAGTDFVRNIVDRVGDCDILLALIGPRWLQATDAKGQRRLDDPGDFLRTEIAIALSREITVVPVLLDGARMPEPNELPPDIAGLARRSAVEIRRVSFDADARRLVQKLGLGGQPHQTWESGPPYGIANFPEAPTASVAVQEHVIANNGVALIWRCVLAVLLLFPLSVSFWIGSEIGVARHWAAWVFLVGFPVMLILVIYRLFRPRRSRDGARQ